MFVSCISKIKKDEKTLKSSDFATELASGNLVDAVLKILKFLGYTTKKDPAREDVILVFEGDCVAEITIFEITTNVDDFWNWAGFTDPTANLLYTLQKDTR